MLSENSLTVTQVNTYIKNTFETDFLLSSLWIKGEISNCKQHSSGHIYMTLKDEGGVLKAVMFKGNTFRLKFIPENGMKIIAHGRISVYERDGQYQLYIDALEPDGTGALYLAFEQMKAKLEQEGLFDESIKKPIPKFPKKIGIITSPTGAAVRDIINILSRRYTLADVTIYPVLVQGEGASNQIAKAIEHVNKNTTCDVIIVGRGGGSIEDLWAFNEEITARAIFASEIPVISAVGHETDFTISDFVADLRAPTPSAAAELATPSSDEIKSYINVLNKRVNIATTSYVDILKNKLEYLSGRISVKSIINNYNKHRLYIDSLLKQAENSVQKNISQNRINFSSLISKLDALSPLKIISRGYSVIKIDNEVVKSVNRVNVNDTVNILLNDGTLNAVVTDKEVK